MSSEVVKGECVGFWGREGLQEELSGVLFCHGLSGSWNTSRHFGATMFPFSSQSLYYIPDNPKVFLRYQLI
jgi:hypothetical protein